MGSVLVAGEGVRVPCQGTLELGTKPQSAHMGSCDEQLIQGCMLPSPVHPAPSLWPRKVKSSTFLIFEYNTWSSASTDGPPAPSFTCQQLNNHCFPLKALVILVVILILFCVCRPPWTSQDWIWASKSITRTFTTRSTVTYWTLKSRWLLLQMMWRPHRPKLYFFPFPTSAVFKPSASSYFPSISL